MVQKLFAALYEDRSRDYTLDNVIHYFGILLKIDPNQKVGFIKL